MQIKKVYVYDETTQKRKESTLVTDLISSEGASTAGDFQGADRLHDGKQGFVPKPLKGDQNKFLRGDGTWASNVPDTDTYLTKAEASQTYVTTVSTTNMTVTSAEAASSAERLTQPVNIKISDYCQSNTATVTAFDGSQDIILPMPQTFKGTLQGNATSANTAAECTGEAASAAKLSKKVKITIKDAEGKIASDPVEFDGSDSDVTLYLPNFTTTAAKEVFGNNASPDMSTVIRIENPDSSDTAAVTANFISNGTTTIKLPATITSAINPTGGVESAKKLAKPVSITIKDSAQVHAGTAVTLDGGSASTTLLLPSIISADINGTASIATRSICDSAGNTISTTYAKLNGATLQNAYISSTPSQSDASNRIATTKFVADAVNAALGFETYNQSGTDTALTPSQLSKAINNDSNFSTTLSKTYQPLHAALTSISGLTTAANKMIYTTKSNVYAVTDLSSLARTALSKTTAANFRSVIEALGTSENAASATKLLKPVKFKLRQVYGNDTVTGAEVQFQGTTDTSIITIPLPDDIRAATAEKLNTPIKLQIRDSSYVHTGEQVDFDGSGNTTLYLPDTISAELNGNAATVTKLKTARKIDGLTFDGSSDVSRFCVCTTSGNTVSKTATCANFTFQDGAIINVLLQNANSATNPTLNINSTGAKAMFDTQGNRLTGIDMDAGVYQFVCYNGFYELTKTPLSRKALALKTARKITLTGEIGGSATFDGSANVTIATAELTHTISTSSGAHDIGGVVETAGPDFARIRAGSTARDAGYLEIATADNGTEPIYARQYTRSTTSVTTPEQGFGSITRTATILGSDGSTSFPVKVNTPKLVATNATITSASISTIGSNSTITGQAYFYNNGTPSLSSAAGAVIIGQHNKNDHIAIGRNYVQARTSVGGAASLHLNTYGGGIYIGDPSTQGNIDLSAPEVGINTRSAYNVAIHQKGYQGDLYINSKTVYLGNAQATVDSDLYVNLPASFNNTTRLLKPVTVTGGATFNGTTALNSTVTVAGTTTVSGKISFTNTTQGNFSVSAGPYINGIRFNGSTNMYCYGYCNTAGGTAAKAVSVTGAGGGFTLTTGSRVTVKFANTNTATNPQLNVNNTGAKTIQYRGSNIPAAAIQANSIYDFVFTDPFWEVVGTMAWAVS